MRAIKKISGALVNSFGADLPDARTAPGVAGEAVALLRLYTLSLSHTHTHTQRHTHTYT
jgi:hypothetical protein